MVNLRAILVSVALSTAVSSVAVAQSSPAPQPLSAAFATSLTSPPPAESLHNRGAFYVPAYSSLRIGSGRTRLDFAVTLSVRNTSGTAPLVVEAIDYFDTSGALVQKYLDGTIALRPLATIEVFVAADDVRGGTGAHFDVKWAALGPISEPVVETVMIGSSGTNGFSVTSAGRAIRLINDR